MNIVHRQRGVALALLLWFIAAMTLLVSGVIGVSKQEVRATQSMLSRAEAEAIGDGIAQLAINGQVFSAAENGQQRQAWIEFAGVVAKLRFIPAQGLVDLQFADVELMTSLFETAAGVEPGDARVLAHSVIEWRTPTKAQSQQRGAGPKIHVLEDVMAVQGFRRSIFEAVKWHVCMGCNQGRFESKLASADLASKLGRDDVLQEQATDSQGRNPLQVMDGRLDVRVALDNGWVVQRSVWISKRGSIQRRFNPFKVSSIEFESGDFVQ